MVRALQIAVVCGFALVALPAKAFEIGLPVDCAIGEDCFIQNYVDHDPGPGTRDYACGGQGYDGHKGTDFRVRTTVDTDDDVPVLAVAPGVVLGARNNMADRLVEDDGDRKAVADKECGNGVRIDHGDGWITQVCHLQRGSVTAKTGDKVERGTVLGTIGYSGLAAFPHVELSIERDGKTVDPFQPEMGAACGEAEEALWTDEAKEDLGYKKGVILTVGLADGAVALRQLHEGSITAPGDKTPVVAYAWAINLLKGDTLNVRLERDGEKIVERSETLDRDKAENMLFAGKKAPKGGWPKGDYQAVVTVLRDGKPAISEMSAPLSFD